MRSRLLRISLIAIMTVWFGVVVPLHPRGIIKLGGSCTETAARPCCQAPKSTSHDSQRKPATSDCAICYFLATLDLPPAIALDIPKLGFVEEATPPARQIAPTIAWVDPDSARGPPDV